MGVQMRAGNVVITWQRDVG